MKNIRNEVRSFQLPHPILSNYRFVSTATLNVRYGNTIRSRIVGKLHFGQVVQVVYKKKNWTLIRCMNEEGVATMEGWVFTRYISRFK